MPFNNLYDAGASPAATLSQLLHIGTGTASNFTFRLGDGTATELSIFASRLQVGKGMDVRGYSAAADSAIRLYQANAAAYNSLVIFSATGAYVGGITQSSTAVTFSTTSDYRLKENVTAMTGALARLAALKPCQFNFKSEPGTRVDGFLAHEVQAVVAEAAHGHKDAVDASGAPIYQGVDAAKLVPLLTAALQELHARVADLQAQITALS